MVQKVLPTPKQRRRSDHNSITSHNVEINRGIFACSFLVECADRLQNNYT